MRRLLDVLTALRAQTPDGRPRKLHRSANRIDDRPVSTRTELETQRGALQIAQTKHLREVVGLKTDLVKLKRAEEGLRRDRVERRRAEVKFWLVVLGIPTAVGGLLGAIIELIK